MPFLDSRWYSRTFSILCYHLTMRTTKLILVRHGETDTNVKEVLHKYGDSSYLTSNGTKQVEVTGEKLKEIGVDKLYTSNEVRALESGKIISHICNIQLNTIEGLEERNWGKLSGKPWSEIKEILGPMTLDERYNYTPPEGESWKSFEERLVRAIKSITKNNTGHTIAAVSHGGSIRALMPYLLGVPKVESFKYDPDNASLSIFEFNERGIEKITVNDIKHLVSLD